MRDIAYNMCCRGRASGDRGKIPEGDEGNGKNDSNGMHCKVWVKGRGAAAAKKAAMELARAQMVG
jgi:hypothetical protein